MTSRLSAVVVRGAALAAVALGIAGCLLPDERFGRPCVDDAGCGGGYVCFQDACVPADFPFEEVALGEACGDAIPLALGAEVRGDTRDALDDASALCGGDGAPDRVYVLDLVERAALVIRLRPDDFDAVVYVTTAACDVPIDGQCADDGGDAFADEELRLSAGPGRVFVVVDGAEPAGAPVAGTFDLRVDVDGTCPGGRVAVPGIAGCVGFGDELTMTRSRTNATATLLLDGRVLIVGGRTDATLTTTATAEVFDPSTNDFSAVGSMGQDRARHAAARLSDGRVVVAGGVSGNNGNYQAIASAEIFDPISNTFSALPDLVVAADLLTLTTLQNDEVLAAGGRDGSITLNAASRLNLTQTFWVPTGLLSDPRFGHVAALLPNGDVLVHGGRVSDDQTAVATVEIYETNADLFVSGPAPSQARAAQVAAALPDGRIVIAGGYRGGDAAGFQLNRTAEVYSPTENAFSDLPLMVQQRTLATASFSPDLGVVVAGGSLDAPLGSVEVYLPGENIWRALPSLSRPRLAHAAATLLDGRVLIVGGDGGVGTQVPLASAELLSVVPP